MLFIKRNRILLIILLLIIGLNISKAKPIYNIEKTYQENNNYIIEIPKIALNVEFSHETILDRGLEISDISKQDNKPMIISGHSGFGPNVYFNDLEYLSFNDEIIIYHGKSKFYYTINKIIYFKKYSEVILPNDSQYLYLITCDKYDLQKQLIISAKLSKIVEY